MKIISNHKSNCSQELQNLRRCQGHPNIVNLIEVFTDEVSGELPRLRELQAFFELGAPVHAILKAACLRKREKSAVIWSPVLLLCFAVSCIYMSVTLNSFSISVVQKITSCVRVCVCMCVCVCVCLFVFLFVCEGYCCLTLYGNGNLFQMHTDFLTTTDSDKCCVFQLHTESFATTDSDKMCVWVAHVLPCHH